MKRLVVVQMFPCFMMKILVPLVAFATLATIVVAVVIVVLESKAFQSNRGELVRKEGLDLSALLHFSIYPEKVVLFVK
jgi:hypothetical protein